ncbi:ATP-dependent DNA helicase Q4-like [Lingula anatina]|uniref:ATP-dependent DNA helicase Q4-like n=1 Tax=Lingula anatina TaxID=7574 RepID=A0A1S3HSM2_LINAN|nr:ATP-dependent DNA helicase Q4-like [Lingula anatina]|eukprot:XP_013389023.1 ATP-dependent DNA helicase Q4-like [Lingula anatina]
MGTTTVTAPADMVIYQDKVSPLSCATWNVGIISGISTLLCYLECTGVPHKTGVMVEFSDLAFHLRSPGDLTNAELDEVLDFHNDRVQMQEKAELYQLQKLHDALQSISFKNYYHCSDDVDMKRSDKLRAMFTDYFEMKPEHSSNMGRISKLSFNRELECSTSGPNEEDSCKNEGYVRGDIRGFISLCGQEHVLSGR